MQTEQHLPELANQPKVRKKLNYWLMIPAAVAVAIMASTVSFYSLSRWWSAAQIAKPATSVKLPKPVTVTALGRLEPRGEVIKLSAPTILSNTSGSRVTKLLVQQGDQVKAGQVIAILDNREYYYTNLEQAQQQVKVARSKLAQVVAGAKAGEINAQKATIASLEAQLRHEAAARDATVKRMEAEVKNAQMEYQRYQVLHQSGAISASTRDSKQLTLETAQAQLNEARENYSQSAETLREKINEAKATLNRIAEVRPVDVQEAQAEVDSGVAGAKHAQADLDLAYVRSPRDGQVLKIYTWPGESVGSNGIVELGQTDQMYVVAEVYQSDISQVSKGQTATVSSNAFSGELKGTVDQIGLRIGKQDILGTDPAADQDARVLEVKIRLSPDSSRKVAGLTNLQARVSIDISNNRTIANH